MPEPLSDCDLVAMQEATEVGGLVGLDPGTNQPAVVDQTYTVMPIAQLKPYPGNPKRHDDKALAESIDETGFYGAVIVQKSTGYILAGHGRVRALEVMELTEVPALVVDVDDEQARKIVLADNRITELGGWDNDLLRDLLLDTAENFDLTGTGYDVDFLDAIIGERTMPTQDFTGGYVESAEDIIKRAQRVATTKAQAGIHETILVFTATEHAQFVEDVEYLKETLDQQSTSDAVLVGIRQLVAEMKEGQ